MYLFFQCEATFANPRLWKLVSDDDKYKPIWLSDLWAASQGGRDVKGNSTKARKLVGPDEGKKAPKKTLLTTASLVF